MRLTLNFHHHNNFTCQFSASLPETGRLRLANHWGFVGSWARTTLSVMMALWGVVCGGVVAAVCGQAGATGGFDRGAEFDQLKAVMHTLTPLEQTARLGQLRAKVGQSQGVSGTGTGTPTPPHQDKIEHVVVLLMENHGLDNMLGCMDLPGLDGVPKEGHIIPVDPSDPSKGNITQSCGTGEYVCKGGPGYNLFSGKFKPGTNSHTYPYDEQSDAFSGLNGAKVRSAHCTLHHIPFPICGFTLCH